MFREYQTLTNRKYRLVTNLVIPIGIMILTLVIWKYFGYLPALSMAAVFMMAEVVEDYFGFGCICKKNSLGMEFLKNGCYGMKYFENAVIVDLFLRPIRIAIYAFAAGWPYISQGGSTWIVFGEAALASIVSVASVNVMRYIDTAQWSVLVSMAFMSVYMCMAVLLLLSGSKSVIIAVILAVVFMTVMAATYSHMAYVIRRSYIDA